MAESCCCHNPVSQFLADTLLDKDGIQQVSDAMGKAGDLECQPVSVMYTGGVIRPMKNGVANQVDAIGFHNGHVVAAGSVSEVKIRMDSLGVTYTTTELANGNALLPGLVEPHVHIVPAAMMMAWHDFSPFEGQQLRKQYNVDWLEGEIKSIDGTLMPKDSWILAQGVDPSLMKFTIEDGFNKLQSLDCDTLDEIMGVSPSLMKMSDTLDEALEGHRPLMMMSASGHTAYVNTAALRKIYSSDTPEEFIAHRKSVYESGGLQELEKIKAAVSAVPTGQISEVNIDDHFDCLFETANQRGVTLMYDAGMNSMSMGHLQKYLFCKKARVRIGYAELCESLKDVQGIAPYVPPTEEFKNVYQGSVKLISDGSNQGLTGYQTEPYCCKPTPCKGDKGLFNHTPYERFADVVKAVVKKGWPLMIHANGNKAIELTVAAYKEALGTASGLVKRHRIEHCSLLNKSNLEEMHTLGVSPSFLIGHVGYVLIQRGHI